MIVLLVVAAIPLGLILLSLLDAVRRPTFRRMALRSIVRRKGEAVLVVLGSLLGTAIITSSFVVGDTFDASIRDLARTQYGPIDTLVTVDDPERLPALTDAVAAAEVAGSDGTLAMLSTPATVATPEGADRRAEPHALVHELDVAAARAFGGDPDATGFADPSLATPGPGETLIGEDLADELEVAVGDAVEVFAYGSTLELTVTDVLPRLGVAGFYPQEGSRSPVLFIAPGTMVPLAASAPAGGGAVPPTARAAVSQAGGVFDGADTSTATVAALEAAVGADDGVEIEAAKADLLADAEDEGAALSELFLSIGMFSVLAGVLLLVNIAVMLTEERKGELGILRAVGLRRNHLVRAFGMEGNVYAVVAATLGAVAGIGVARLVVVATQSIVGGGDGEGGGLDLRFTAEPDSLVTGFLIGLGICVITVWATSARIGRLNVIRAIRDLPEPPGTGRRRLRRLVLAAGGVVLGGLLTTSGVGGEEPFSALLGPAVALWCSVPLLRRLLPGRWAVTVPCGVALAWGVLAFSLLPDVFADVDIPVFVLQGLVLVGSAVALASTNGDLVGRLGERGGPALRIGLANPLAKRFRTALLLGMYSIVVFVLVFLATLAGIFQSQGPRLADDTRAGYDVLVASNAGNPVTEATLREQPEVDEVATLVQAFPDFTITPGSDELEEWAITGFDEALVARGTPVLSSRDAAYASDAEAFAAVLVDPALAIVPDVLLQDDGPPGPGLEIGDDFDVVDPVTGDRHTLTAAGIVEGDWTFNGVLVGTDALAGFVSESAPVRHYVGVADGVDPGTVADALTGRLVANGVDASTFVAAIDDELAEQTGFFNLMQGFLALGLLIGIAGLGVVMVRAVRERRRQIGMLRAMGFRSATVRSAFLIEAAFVAVQGIVIGVALGLLTAWTLLTTSEAFGDEALPFAVPWPALALLVGVALSASLLAVAAPARQASRTLPAVALRIAD
ncbi:MAG: ABC transporter permease [Acidimicrobiia bacterium]|nr:ABC transporter permease [Acidimicrobiia bacterium]